MIDLKKTSELLRTQNNRATAHPLFIVYEKERIYGVDPDFHDDVFHDDVFEEMEINYIEKNRFVSAHFTEAAAERYIAENNHNLEKPFVYAASMYMCHEMIAIREFLMGIEK